MMGSTRPAPFRTHCCGVVLIASPVRHCPSSLRTLTHRNHRSTLVLALSSNIYDDRNTFDILSPNGTRHPPHTHKHMASLLRAAAAVAAATLITTSACGDNAGTRNDGGSGSGGGESLWDSLPDVLTSCDFGGAGELDFGGILTFLGPMTCTKPTVRRCSVCVWRSTALRLAPWSFRSMR